MFIAALAAAALWTAAGCTATQTSASAVDDPDPEIVGEPTDISDEVPARAGDPESVAPAIGSLVMIGDSITVASAVALEERFVALGLDDVVIEAQTGKRIAQGAQDNSSGTVIARGLVEDAAAAGDTDHSDALWVIALGTNDVNQYADGAEIALVVDELLAEVPAASTLIWVDTFHAADTTAADLLNRAVAVRLAARGNAVIVEWSEVAAYDGVLRSDGIHPSTSGVEVFAATVAATVDDVLES
jgi:lysophospholipase L1-like esterase